MDRNEGEAPLSDRGSMRDTMIGGETGQWRYWVDVLSKECLWNVHQTGGVNSKQADYFDSLAINEKKIPWSCTGLELTALPLVSKWKFNASRLNKAKVGVGEIKVTKLYNCVLALHCTTRSNTVYSMFKNNITITCVHICNAMWTSTCDGKSWQWVTQVKYFPNNPLANTLFTLHKKTMHASVV